MATSHDSAGEAARRSGDAPGSLVLVDGSNVAHSSEGDQAVTRMRSKGDSSGHPREPSPVR